MSILKKRMLVTLVAMISVAAAGLWLATFLAAAFTQAREGKLRQEAARLLVGVEAFSSESRAVLDAMNASSLPYCSDAEITLFRTLIFRSPYLKDGGRMSNGQIVCSAVVGRAACPVHSSRQLTRSRTEPVCTTISLPCGRRNKGCDSATGRLIRRLRSAPPREPSSHSLAPYSYVDQQSPPENQLTRRVN